MNLAASHNAGQASLLARAAIAGQLNKVIFHPMKSFFLGLFLLLGHALLGQPFLYSQPYETNGVLAALDFDNDGVVDSSYLLVVNGAGSGFVYTALESDEHVTYLKSSAKTPEFQLGENIALTAVAFTNKGNFASFAFDAYHWYFDTIFQRLIYFRLSGGEFPTQTNVLVGLRFLGGDSEPHHAWIRFTRPRNPNNAAGVPYQVAGYDYNPVPGEPIPAGLPPPAPELLAALEPDGNLRLSWDAKYEPYYKLQGRSDLSDPDGWLDLPNVFGHTFPVLPDGPTAFFRLARR
jgi:hypothetical protein